MGTRECLLAAAVCFVMASPASGGQVDQRVLANNIVSESVEQRNKALRAVLALEPQRNRPGAAVCVDPSA